MSEIDPGTKIITQDNAWDTIPEEMANDIIKGVVAESASLTMFRRRADMFSASNKVPVMSGLGDSKFTSTNTHSDSLTPPGVDDEIDRARQRALESGGKLPIDEAPGEAETTDFTFKGVYFNAEEISTLVAVPKTVLDDSNFALFDEIMPSTFESMGIVIDNATILGQDAPDTWPSGLIPSSFANGNFVTFGSDLADDTSELMGKLEALGFDPTDWIMHPTVKAQLRALKTTDGIPIFAQGLAGGVPATLHGVPISYLKNGVMRTDLPVVVGDMSQIQYSIRQEFTVEFFRSGVITDNTGLVIVNALTQGMIIMKATMRLAWAVPRPATRLSDGALPFGTLIGPIT